MTNIQKCLELQEKAKQLIPGMNQLLSKRPDQFSMGTWPGYYKKAEGVNVTDLDGNSYTDMSISGIGANILGYADPDVNEAVIRAIQDGVSCSLNCPEEVELSELLCELHPWADMARFSKGGGEALAIAVRIARAHTRKDKIAFCGYHGWQDWYLAANLGDTEALNGHLLPGLSPEGVPKGLAQSTFPFEYNNTEQFKSIINTHSDDLACVVMESIRGQKPDEDFIKTIRETCTEKGIVLIIDEVSAGFRLTTGGAHLVLDIHPDISVFSKALGNGFPISAIIGKAPIMKAAETSFISSTNWTERSGFAAALATIKKHKRTNTAAHINKLGTDIQNGWANAAKSANLEIKPGGIPPLSNFQFLNDSPPESKAFFIQEMLKEGYLASNLFYPMLAHTDEHVSDYLHAVERTFKKLRSALDSSIKDHLEGAPAAAGFKRLTS